MRGATTYNGASSFATDVASRNETEPLRPTKQRATFPRRLGLALAATAVVYGVGSVDWRPARPPAAPTVLHSAARSGALLAGAGRASVALPPDVPLAGFSPFGRAAEGPATPTAVRVLMLEVASERIAVVLLELMTVPPSLLDALRGRLAAEGVRCGLVAATHTHAGPGGYDRAFVPQAVAIGRFDERVEFALLQAASTALASARAELGAADLATTEARQEGLSFNRDRSGAPVDDLMTKLVFSRPDGAPVATVVRFAAHATLTPRHVGPSGGWPSVAMTELEGGGGVAFLLQGAVGDVSADPRETGAEGEARDREYGALVARRAGALDAHEVQPPIALGCSEVEFALPVVDLRGAVPRPLAPISANAATPFAPETARVAALRLDDLVLLGTPAEPTREAALGAEAALALEGLRGRTVSLTQGYVGYAPLPHDFEDRVMSARLSWFGPELAPRLSDALGAATAAVLGRPSAAASPAVGDAR